LDGDLMFHDMTPKQILAQLWVWLTSGFTPASIALGLVSDLMIFIMWMKSVYGVSVYWWETLIISIIGVLGLLLIGYVWIKSKFQESITSYNNEHTNKEWNDHVELNRKINERLERIEKKMGEKL
jgi:hypothetical protein